MTLRNLIAISVLSGLLMGCSSVQRSPGELSPYVQVAVKYATAKYIRNRVDAARTVLDVTTSFLEVLSTDSAETPITVTLLEQYARAKLESSGLPLEDQVVLAEIMRLVQADLLKSGVSARLNTVELRAVLEWARDFAETATNPTNLVLK